MQGQERDRCVACGLQEFSLFIETAAVILRTAPERGEIRPHFFDAEAVECFNNGIDIVVLFCRDVLADEFMCETGVREEYAVDPVHICKLLFIRQGFP